MRNYDDMDYIRAAIGIRDLDGTIRVITVDEKGYPGFTGALLVAKYQQEEKVEKLIGLGDLMRLEEDLEPTSNHPHYIIINGNKRKKQMQERVTVAKYRDIRVNIDGILKKQKKQSYREYHLEVDVYYSEGVEYVYIYDLKTKFWETHSTGLENPQFMELPLRRLNYRRLINNLIDGENIEVLTTEEKQYLALYKY